MELQNVIDESCQPIITLLNLPTGCYDILVNGSIVQQVEIKGQKTPSDLYIPGLTASTNNVVIRRASSLEKVNAFPEDLMHSSHSMIHLCAYSIRLGY